MFLDGEDGDDVRVVERGDGPGFPSEARQTVGVSREGIGKNLQRDITIQFRVARAVDLAHGAGTKRGDDLVRTDAKTGGEEWARLRAVGRHLREMVDTPRLTATGSPPRKLSSEVSDVNSDSTSRRSASSSPVAAARKASRSSTGRSTAA